MARQPREERKARIPVSANRSPLKYKGLDIKNFYHRWVLDRDDRIPMFLEAGYEFVNPTGKMVGESTVDSQSQDGSRVSKPAGFGGRRLVLMRIPLKYWEEDQALKAREVDEIEKTMRTPKKDGVVNDQIDYGKIALVRSNTPQTADSD